jgi:hypothetical protein
MPTDPTCACGNAARYVNERGQLSCAICPLKEGIDSVRIADIPELLSVARSLIKHGDSQHVGAQCRQLRTLLGKAPK